MHKDINSRIRRRIGGVVLAVGVASTLLGCLYLLPVLHGYARPEPCYKELPVGGDERDRVRGAVEVSRITLFPFGLDCTWGWPGGAQETRYFWDLHLNSILYGGATLGVFGYVLLVRPQRHDPDI